MSTDFYKSLSDNYKSLSDKYVQLTKEYNDFVDLASMTIDKLEEFNDKYTPDPFLMRVLLQKRLSEIRPLLTSTEDLGKWKRLNRMVNEKRSLSKEDYMTIKKDIDETFDLSHIYDNDSDVLTESDEEFLSETL